GHGVSLERLYGPTVYTQISRSKISISVRNQIVIQSKHMSHVPTLQRRINQKAQAPTLNTNSPDRPSQRLSEVKDPWIQAKDLLSGNGTRHDRRAVERLIVHRDIALDRVAHC